MDAFSLATILQDKGVVIRGITLGDAPISPEAVFDEIAKSLERIEQGDFEVVVIE